MFPTESCALSGPCSGVLIESLQVGSFWLQEFATSNHLGLLYGHLVIWLSFHDHLGAFHLGIEVLPWVDNFGFLIGCSFFGSLLAQWCLKIPNYPLPFEVQRPLHWKHVISSSVSIWLEFHEVYQWTVTVAATCHSNGRSVDWVTLWRSFHLLYTSLRGGVQWWSCNVCLWGGGMSASVAASFPITGGSGLQS